LDAGEQPGGGGATLDTPNLNGKGHLSGSAANRLLTCIQLYHKLKVPIIVSGGQAGADQGREAEIARRILLDAGIPEDQILVETESRNTIENARFVKKILDRYDCYDPILVTSAFHMDRAVRAFTKVRVGVVPYPTDYRANVSNRFSWRMLMPSAEAMSDVSLVVKEYLGDSGGRVELGSFHFLITNLHGVQILFERHHCGIIKEGEINAGKTRFITKTNLYYQGIKSTATAER